MEFRIENVTGIGDYVEENSVFSRPDGKVFLVVHPNTVEVRTDGNLRRLLTEKYESVMKSRYFGRNGIEVVLSGQLEEEEINDLVRLSYNLSTEDNISNSNRVSVS